VTFSIKHTSQYQSDELEKKGKPKNKPKVSLKREKNYF